MGITTLKFFPATALGLPLLKAMSAPYASAGVRWMPTGGELPKLAVFDF